MQQHLEVFLGVFCKCNSPSWCFICVDSKEASLMHLTLVFQTLTLVFQTLTLVFQTLTLVFQTLTLVFQESTVIQLPFYGNEPTFEINLLRL